MESTTLKEMRGRIDQLDRRIAELVRERVLLANEIIAAKPPGRIVDREREVAIGRVYTETLGPVSTPEKVARLVRAILAASRDYPEN